MNKFLPSDFETREEYEQAFNDTKRGVLTSLNRVISILEDNQIQDRIDLIGNYGTMNGIKYALLILKFVRTMVKGLKP